MPSARNNDIRSPPRVRRNGFLENEQAPAKPSKAPLIIVMAVLVVALIIVVAAIGVFSVPNEEGDTVELRLFSSGSDNIILGGKGETQTGYIKLPKDADVKNVKFNVTGMLPDPLERYEAGVEPKSIVSSDLDSDGDMDVVVLNAGNNKITVLKNLGAYGFVLSNFDTPPNSVELTTDYLNDDAYLDIALVSSDDTVAIYLTATDAEGNWNFNYPSYTEYTVGEFSYSICTLDYDVDGDNDVVASCKNSDTLTFLKNQGDGTFTSGGEVSTEHKPGGMATADLNEDGYPDIVVINRGDTDYTLDGHTYRYTVSIFFSNKGAFDSHIDYGVGENPSAIDISDIDQDGLWDIIVSNEGYGVDSVSVLINQGNGVFPTGNDTEVGAKLYKTIDPNDIICADLNGDTYPDVATACRTTDSIAVLLNDGTGELMDYKQYFVGYSPKSLAAADFDLDGDLDITTANMRALDTTGILKGSVSIIRNLGYGVFSTDTEYSVGNCPRGISTADFDNDNDMDIATANYFGSTLSVLPNDGQGRFGKQDTYLLGLEPYAVQAGDFDGDGFIDVASADEARFVVIILFNDGTGHFKNERPDYNIGGYPFSLHTGDYNDDGHMDVITANHGQGTLAILYNKGNGTFEDYVEIDLGPTRLPFDISIEDVNEDGYKDIITANLGTDNAYTNTVSILMNKGDNTYAPPVDYFVGWGPTSVAVVDFDGDGDKDIASSNLGDGTVSILKNSGDGTFTNTDTLTVGTKPYFIKAMDFDFDGDPDLIATNSHSNSMDFLQNDGTGVFTKYYEKILGSYPYQISIADLDKDGRDDIVATNVNTASVSIVSDYYYPKDVAIDIDGNPQTKEYTLTKQGILDGSERTANLATGVQSYLDSHQHLADEDGNILVPITLLRSEAGMAKLSDLVVEYIA